MAEVAMIRAAIRAKVAAGDHPSRIDTTDGGAVARLTDPRSIEEDKRAIRSTEVTMGRVRTRSIEVPSRDISPRVDDVRRGSIDEARGVKRSVFSAGRAHEAIAVAVCVGPEPW